MTVYFIGAGPGAADLITVRGLRILERIPVCLYAGSLVPQELLDACSAARVVDTARLDLDQITAELVAAHERRQDVARLHSGDPSIYSAVAEQIRRLDAAGVPYEIVPGVPAFAAAAAALGRELTVPSVAQSVVLTRVATLSTPMPPGEELTTFARTGTTLAIHLAAAQITTVAADLATGYAADCPVAVVAFASQPREQIIWGTVSSIAALVQEAGITKTAIILVGPALAARDFAESYLYSRDRRRGATH